MNFGEPRSWRSLRDVKFASLREGLAYVGSAEPFSAEGLSHDFPVCQAGKPDTRDRLAAVLCSLTAETLRFGINRMDQRPAHRRRAVYKRIRSITRTHAWQS